MVWNNQGTFYEWLGQTDQANDAYGRALELLKKRVTVNPNEAVAHAYLALRLLKQQGDATRALSHLRTALALQPRSATEPKDGRVLQIAGAIQWEIGDKAKAINYIVESMKYGREFKDFELDPDMRGMMGDSRARAKLERAQASASIATNNHGR
jgi:tetratricopeptide (TPR) repeat protein